MNEQNTKKSADFSEISEIVSEYTEWYNQILCHLVYPDEMDPESLPRRNARIFEEWIAKAQDQELLGDGTHESLHALCKDFHELIEKLSAKALQNKEKLQRKDFETLTTFFEEFMVHLRRLEQDSALKDNGIDMLTGLRHKSVMYDDLAKEMERLARRGRPFCLALARIDQYEALKVSLSQRKTMEYTKTVAGFIKRCIRSFDDAYRIDDGLFLLSLKQTDITGGLAALDRLKKLMESNDVRVDLEGKQVPMTLSCCIAEPVVGDKVDTLLGNLKDDLDGMETEVGSVLEYIEMSPLQRYIKTEG